MRRRLSSSVIVHWVAQVRCILWWQGHGRAIWAWEDVHAIHGKHELLIAWHFSVEWRVCCARTKEKRIYHHGVSRRVEWRSWVHGLPVTRGGSLQSRLGRWKMWYNRCWLGLRPNLLLHLCNWKPIWGALEIAICLGHHSVGCLRASSCSCCCLFSLFLDVSWYLDGSVSDESKWKRRRVRVWFVLANSATQLFLNQQHPPLHLRTRRNAHSKDAQAFRRTHLQNTINPALPRGWGAHAKHKTLRQFNGGEAYFSTSFLLPVILADVFKFYRILAVSSPGAGDTQTYTPRTWRLSVASGSHPVTVITGATHSPLDRR